VTVQLHSDYPLMMSLGRPRAAQPTPQQLPAAYSHQNVNPHNTRSLHLITVRPLSFGPFLSPHAGEDFNVLMHVGPIVRDFSHRARTDTQRVMRHSVTDATDKLPRFRYRRHR